MLNRTNRTLSANLNGLNLGTRSFVVKANAFNGNPTLLIPHTHQHAMRDGTMMMNDPMIRRSSWIVRSWIPCSSVGSSWPVVSHTAKFEPAVSESRRFHVDLIDVTLLSKREKYLTPIASQRANRSPRHLVTRPFAQPRLETYRGLQQGLIANRPFTGGRATSGRCLANAPAAARG